ncbi:hypothetical protein [Kordiimonas sp.]|uniref:hypothetical protein n=1 Tax=Kordiimonas sp. TaxID=1970157 RepID=UPI003A8CE26B
MSEKTARIPVDLLRAGIESLLDCHPHITRKIDGPKVHLIQYRAHNGEPIGHESKLTTMQNLWVRRGAINLSEFADLPISNDLRKTKIEAAERESGNKRGGNSNLFSLFPKEDLLKFAVRDLNEAARLIFAVAGNGSPKP